MAMTSNFERDITTAIQEAVRKKVDQIVKEETSKAIGEIVDRLKEEVDSIALSVLSHYDLSMGMHGLHITVKKELNGPKV